MLLHIETSWCKASSLEMRVYRLKPNFATLTLYPLKDWTRMLELRLIQYINGINIKIKQLVNIWLNFFPKIALPFWISDLVTLSGEPWNAQNKTEEYSWGTTLYCRQRHVHTSFVSALLVARIFLRCYCYAMLYYLLLLVHKVRIHKRAEYCELA